MRIVVASDIHSSFSNLRRLIARNKADVLAVCGDITDFSREDVGKFLKVIENFDGTCLVVHGNCDYSDAFEDIENDKVAYIHGKSLEIEGIVFHGLGGSTFTPFNTPSEYDEKYYYRLLQSLNYGENNVLISHSPPYGILDSTHSGINAGSKAIRDFLDRFDYVFCGHIHEARGIAKVGKTEVINPGSLSNGFYAKINLGRESEILSL